MDMLVAAFAAVALQSSQPATPPVQGPGPTSTSPASAPSSRDALAAMHRTCAVDFKARCPSMAAGSPELRACVQAHFAELSSPCQTAIQDAVMSGGAG